MMFHRDKKECMNFYVADSKKIKSLVNSYNEYYTKEDVVDLLDSIRKSIKSQTPIYVDANGELISVPDAVTKVFGPRPKRTYYSLRKDALVEALAYFNADSRNARLRNVTLKDNRNQLLNLIAANGMVGMPEVKKLMGEDAISIDTRYWWNFKVKLRPDLKMFRAFAVERRHTYHTTEKDVYVRLPEKMIDDFISSVFPSQPVVPDPNPTGSTDILTVNCMNTIARWFSLASVMLESGSISIGKTKLVSKSDLKKYRKMVVSSPVSEAVEAALDNPVDDTVEVSLEGIALMAYLFYKSERLSQKESSGNDGNEAAKIVKDIVATLGYAYCKHPQILNMMLPTVSGITRGRAGEMLSSLVMKCMYTVFHRIDDKQWNPVDNLVHEIYRQLYIRNREILIPYDGIWPELEYVDPKTSVRMPIEPGDAVRKLTFPLVRGYLFFLTALGVLETTVDLNMDVAEGDPFDSFKYTRLTPLGMYAFGRGPEVDISVNSDYIHNFELIDNPLIVVSRDADNPYNSWLNKIGTRCGNRWIVTPGSFLSGCKNLNEMEALITDFKKYICDKPSAVWQIFFDRMKSNEGAGSMIVDYERYVVYHVNRTNKDLLRFITADPEIDRLIIRAEDFRILVRREDDDRFRLILRNAGYLI